MLATVILIAITLIAAIAGFVFGLFGSFTSSAQVTASVTTCSADEQHKRSQLLFNDTRRELTRWIN